MAKNKTTQTAKSAKSFVDNIDDEAKRDDAFALIKMMENASGEKATMWGPSIIGFGSYHYKYDSGHEGDAPLIAFSPRSTALVLYVRPDDEKREALLRKLGKVKPTKGCIYVKRLADVDLPTLKKFIDEGLKNARKKVTGS